MLATGTVKKMKRFGKEKNERAQKIFHVMGALKRRQVVAEDSHRDMCVHGQ